MAPGDPGPRRAARRRAAVERIVTTRRKEKGMAREGNGVIWMNGTFVPYEDAKIHVLSHVVHYGSSVFEAFGRTPHPAARRCSASTGTCSACSTPARSPGS